MPRRKTEPETEQGAVATMESPEAAAAHEPFNKRQIAELNIGPKPMKKLKDFDYCEDLAAYLRDFDGGADGAFEFLKIDSSDAELIRVELTRILGPAWLPETVAETPEEAAVETPAEPEPVAEPVKTPKPVASSNGQPHDVGQFLMDEWAAVEEAEADWEAAKEEAADCKKVYDKRLEAYGAAVREQRNPPPLFAQADRASTNGQHVEPAAETPATDESWRTVPLSEALIGITEKVIEKLADAGLRTVGDLEAFSAADHWSHPDRKIKGIGPETVAKIGDAMMKFWERRNMPAPTPAPEPAPEAAAEAAPAAADVPAGEAIDTTDAEAGEAADEGSNGDA